MRIAIVEDYQLICDLLCKICAEAGHQVVCAADTGNDAVGLIVLNRPELVILDLMLPDIDGFAVAEEIRKRRCHLLVLGISSRCDAYTVHRVQSANFQGFIDKRNSCIGHMREAVDSLASGAAWYSESYLRVRERLRNDSDGFTKVLSDRQQTVLAMIGDHADDQEIASRLGVKPATCEKDRYRIRQRLGLDSREELYRFARTQGFSSHLTGLDGSKTRAKEL